MWCLRLLPLALIAACHRPAPMTLPHGPLASSMAAWIPADALLVVVGTPGDGLRAVDEVTAAIGWTTVGELLPDGTRMRIVLEAEVNALCREVAPDAPLPAGPVRTTAGALLISVGDDIVVMRGAVACTIRGGAASRRDHHALRLAGLTDDERLLLRPDARAALTALPDAPLVLWGGGDLLAGISVDRMDPDAGLALAALGDVAVAVGVDAGEQRAWIVVAAATAADAAPHAATTTTIAVGPRVRPPVPAALTSLPVPMRDENVDVPESVEYQQTVGRLGAVLSEAIEARKALGTIEASAVEAYLAGWGEAELARPRRHGVSLVELRWTPPAWPVEATRAAALQAYHQRIDADAGPPRARHDALLAEARALVEELVKIRARDVAAWDKTHR